MSTRSAVEWDRGFTGYITDKETELLHARARPYSSAKGSFLSRDILGYPDGNSSYLLYYVPSSLDPWGLFAVTTSVEVAKKYGKPQKNPDANGETDPSTITATYPKSSCTKLTKDEKGDCEETCSAAWYDVGEIAVKITIIINSSYKKAPNGNGAMFDCKNGVPGNGPDSVPVNEDFVFNHEQDHANKFGDIIKAKIDELKKEKCTHSCRRKIEEHHLQTCSNEFKKALANWFSQAKAAAVAAGSSEPTGGFEGESEKNANKAACKAAGKIPGF